MVRAVSCFSHMFISRRTIKVETIVSPTMTIVSKISRIMIQSSIETENSLILYKNWGFVELHKYFLFLMYEIIFKVTDMAGNTFTSKKSLPPMEPGKTFTFSVSARYSRNSKFLNYKTLTKNKNRIPNDPLTFSPPF